MRTLKCRSNPANMDVVLKGKGEDGKDCLLFIESKFLEYTESKSFELSESYEKKAYWYMDNIQWDEIIRDVRGLVNGETGKKVTNKYGVKQLITHLFGITSLKCVEARKWFNDNNKPLSIEEDDLQRIKFISLVFEPDDVSFKVEHSQYHDYVKFEEKFLEILEGKNLNDNYWPVPKTYFELWKDMESQIKDPQLKEFLKQRYMRFAKDVQLS